MLGKLKRTTITLDPEDIQQLKAIVMDEDAQGALAFVIEVVDQKVQCAQTELHKTALEGETGEVHRHMGRDRSH